jgi:Uma2 family endonuclease
VFFDQSNVVEPDIIYLSHGRAEQISTSAHLRGAPELVVEVASPSTRKRDETVKSRSACTRGRAWTSVGSSTPKSMWYACID